MPSESEPFETSSSPGRAQCAAASTIVAQSVAMPESNSAAPKPETSSSGPSCTTSALSASISCTGRGMPSNASTASSRTPSTRTAESPVSANIASRSFGSSSAIGIVARIDAMSTERVGGSISSIIGNVARAGSKGGAGTVSPAPSSGTGTDTRTGTGAGSAKASSANGSSSVGSSANGSA